MKQITRTPIALVMKGGGIKGLAYVGALEVLSRKYEFSWFVGTSAGAIAAILLGAGYTHNELSEILKAKDFRDFFDAKWYQLIPNLWFYKGFYHADSLTTWIDALLAKKLSSPVRVSLSKLPKCKRVTVYASRRGKSVLTFDSYRDGDDAAYAARCSMSIPLIFVPQSHQGLRTYDGGIKYNYPVDKLLEDCPETKFIGLYLGAETYEGVGRTSLIADIVSIVMESAEPDNIETYRDSTIIIDTRPINTLDFALTDLEKEFLLQTGRTAALAYIDDKSEEYRAAIRRRDSLKESVEATRKAKAVQRRRRRNRALAVSVMLITSVATWWVCHEDSQGTAEMTVAPRVFSDISISGLTTLLCQDALRNKVVGDDTPNEARLRSLMRNGMRETLIEFNPNQHRQCLVSLCDMFKHDYDAFSMDIAIRVEPQLELRKANAYLVRFGDDGIELSSRKMEVDIPEINNHTGTIRLNNPKAGESLFLVIWVGTERDDLDLTRNSAGYYMLTLTKAR